MSWDADEREVREAVAEGDADRVWSMLEHAYEERDEARAALAAAHVVIQRVSAALAQHDEARRTREPKGRRDG